MPHAHNYIPQIFISPNIKSFKVQQHHRNFYECQFEKIEIHNYLYFSSFFFIFLLLLIFAQNIIIWCYISHIFHKSPYFNFIFSKQLKLNYCLFKKSPIMTYISTFHPKINPTHPLKQGYIEKIHLTIMPFISIPSFR